MFHYKDFILLLFQQTENISIKGFYFAVIPAGMKMFHYKDFILLLSQLVEDGKYQDDYNDVVPAINNVLTKGF